MDVPATGARSGRQTNARGRNQTLLGFALDGLLLGGDDGESKRALRGGMAPAVLHHQAGDRHKAD